MAGEAAIFFESPAELRQWLEKNHASASELWVGYRKKGSSRSGISYEQALEEALCFGWIDGLTRGRDEHTYVQRFSPRRRTSKWSEPNIRRVEQLIAQGRMRPAGLAAFERRRRD